MTTKKTYACMMEIVKLFQDVASVVHDKYYELFGSINSDCECFIFWYVNAG